MRMLMGGMVGSIVYEGEIGKYLPILELASKVHIGKQTTFGMGKIRAEAGRERAGYRLNLLKL